MAGSSSPSISSPPSAAVGVNGGMNSYILHTVSKFDTLAGVAIKYGVEVSDIKRLNGLVTDLQMFALTTLQIPLPGKHPPSASLSNCHDTSQRRSISRATQFIRSHSDIFDSFESLKPSSEYREIYSSTTLRHFRKSKSMCNGLASEQVEKRVSYNFSNRAPEKLLKEENTSASPVSAITGKCLALRTKSASRTVSGGIECDLANAFINDGVRKSSSESSLLDSDNGMLVSIWATSKYEMNRGNKVALD